MNLFSIGVDDYIASAQAAGSYILDKLLMQLGSFDPILKARLWETFTRIEGVDEGQKNKQFIHLLFLPATIPTVTLHIVVTVYREREDEDWVCRYIDVTTDGDIRLALGVYPEGYQHPEVNGYEERLLGSQFQERILRVLYNNAS